MVSFSDFKIICNRDMHRQYKSFVGWFPWNINIKTLAASEITYCLIDTTFNLKLISRPLKKYVLYMSSMNEIQTYYSHHIVTVPVT